MTLFGKSDFGTKDIFHENNNNNNNKTDGITQGVPDSQK